MTQSDGVIEQVTGTIVYCTDVSLEYTVTCLSRIKMLTFGESSPCVCIFIDYVNA